MNIQNNLGKAGIILLATFFICSSTVAVAPINPSATPLSTTTINNKNLQNRDIIIWDNVVGVYGALGGIIVSVVRPDGIAFPADDFQLAAPTTVDKVFWQGGYFQCELAQGMIDYDWDWRIIFWEDSGTGTTPGNEMYNQTIPTATIVREHWYNWVNPDNNREYWVANYSAQIPETPTFAANTKYWITIQGVGAYPPQACWSRHNETVGGILLHQAVFKGALWGFPNWVDISTVVTDGLPHDLNFQLINTEIMDTTPPETTCELDGTLTGTAYTSDVTVTLTATDDMSGVAATYYKIDDGTYTEYTAPFILSANGDHTISYYSVDNAQNQEPEQTCDFTILQITITFSGGAGLKMTITNTGTEDITDLECTLSLTGGIIILGKEKTDVFNIPAGQTAELKSFVLGFGKTSIIGDCGIIGDTGHATKEATGTIILFFFLGVA